MSVNVYCAGFPNWWQESNLRDLFGTFGEIDNIKVLLDKTTNQGRGVSFVKFKIHQNALEAVKNQNGKPVNDEKNDNQPTAPLQVRFALDKGSDAVGNPGRGTSMPDGYGPARHTRPSRPPGGPYGRPPPFTPGAPGAFEAKGPVAPTHLLSGELNTNVYVAGIPHSFSKEDLTKMCEKYGEIDSVKVLVDGATGKGRGVGFVKFKLVDSASAAIASLHGQKCEGGTETMVARLAKDKAQEFNPPPPRGGGGYAPPPYAPSYAPPPSSYYPPSVPVSSGPSYDPYASMPVIPSSTLAPSVLPTADPYAPYYAQSPYGATPGAGMAYTGQSAYPSTGYGIDPYSAPQGYGYPPTSSVGASAGYPGAGSYSNGGGNNSSGAGPYGKPMSFQPALQPERKKGSDPDPGEPSPNLFILGLPFEWTEDSLKQVFGQYGTLVGHRIMRDPQTQQSKGFGFVNFQSTQEADAARQALNNYQVQGTTGPKTLKVSFKSGKPPAKFAGGGGSFGGGGQGQGGGSSSSSSGGFY